MHDCFPEEDDATRRAEVHCAACFAGKSYQVEDVFVASQRYSLMRSAQCAAVMQKRHIEALTALLTG